MYKIVFDHPDFLLVNKSPGVSVHKDLSDRGLLEVIKQDSQLPSLFLTHRLDKPTSGLLLLAKNERANSQLSQSFQNRTVEKFYLALSAERPTKKQGQIKGDMAKARRGAWKLTRTSENPAITRFFSYSVIGLGRLFLVRPYTGKTHQIRVALKSIGTPILGDHLYGGQLLNGEERCYLHAYALRFTLDGQRYEFICAPSEGQGFMQAEVQQLLVSIGPPWELKWH